MADTPISSLPSTTIAGGEDVPLVQGGVTYKAPLGSMAAQDADAVAITGGSVTGVTGIRTRLTADTDYYVATTGSNITGTGAIGAPWQTLQFAYDYVAKNIDLAGFDVTISLADGTYTAGLIVHMPLVSSADYGADSWHFQIIGNTGTPANVIVQGAADDAVANWQCGTRVWIEGFTVESASAAGIAAYDNAYIAYRNMRFGACDESHVKSDRGGVLINETGGSYTIAGNAGNHFEASSGGKIQVRTGNTVTVSGTPAFSDAFADIRSNSNLQTTGVTYTGAATGKRFAVEGGGQIETGTDDFNFFPGNVDGTLASGGIYDSIVAGGEFFGDMDIDGSVTTRSAVRWTSDITPAQLTANTDNYNPTGLSTAACLRLSTDASRNLTGIAGGADGRILIIHNIGAQNLVLINDATSTAANRFLLGANLTLTPDTSATLRYDSTSQRWRRI